MADLQELINHSVRDHYNMTKFNESGCKQGGKKSRDKTSTWDGKRVRYKAYKMPMAAYISNVEIRKEEGSL